MKRTFKQFAITFLTLILSNTTFSQKAINFDDDGEYISFGGVSTLDVNQITIECWVKLDEARPGVIIAKPGAYFLRINDALNIDAGFYDNDTDTIIATWHSVTGTTILDINEFYHIAFTYNGTTLKTYLNGELEASSDFSGSIDALLNNGVYAGSHIYIDDYSDYTYASEDKKIYVHENYSNNNTSGQEIDVSNQRYYFYGDNTIDNEDEAISIIKGFTGLDYIVEVDERFGQENGIAYISKRFNNVSDKYEIALEPEPGKDGIYLNKVVNDDWFGLTSAWVGLVNQNEWNTIRTQITTLPSTNNIKAWFNGTLVQWYDDPNYYNSWEDPDLRNFDKLAILVHDHFIPPPGVTYDIYFDNLKVFIPLKGTIDEIRIFNTELSQTTILNWMCKEADNTHPNWSNLKGYWKFDDNTNPTQDYSGNGNSGDITGANFVNSNIPAGYANNYGTGNSNLTETIDVQVDINWDGNEPGENAVFSVLQINDNPNITNGLLSEYPQKYWEINIDGDDGSFNADVNFHYDNISGITNESAWKLYNRNSTGDAWSLVTGTTTNTEGDNSDGIGYITANNLSGFSQFIICSSSSAQITIDGNFSDWVGVPAYVTDDNSDNGGGDVDLTFGYYTYFSNVLYLKTNVAGSFNPTGSNQYIIYFDTDKNTNTGFTAGWWSMGADYRVAHYSAGSHLYSFAGATQDEDTWTWITSVNSDYLGTSCEVAINFSDIGLTSADAIWLQWRAESGTDAMPGFSADRSDLSAPLPVEMSSFSAQAIKNNVLLNWQTETEVDNYGFEIEKQIGSKQSAVGNWEKIGIVEGHGNSNSPKQYSFTDKNPVGESKFQYRLKQIDTDGKFEYSDIVEVELVPNEFILYQNYPNPFNPNTTIKYALPFESKVKIVLYNSLGERITELVNKLQSIGYQQAVWNASNVASGVYIYTIEAVPIHGVKPFTSVKKMMLIK